MTHAYSVLLCPNSWDAKGSFGLSRSSLVIWCVWAVCVHRIAFLKACRGSDWNGLWGLNHRLLGAVECTRIVKPKGAFLETITRRVPSCAYFFPMIPNWMEDWAHSCFPGNHCDREKERKMHFWSRKWVLFPYDSLRVVSNCLEITPAKEESAYSGRMIWLSCLNTPSHVLSNSKHFNSGDVFHTPSCFISCYRPLRGFVLPECVWRVSWPLSHQVWE